MWAIHKWLLQCYSAIKSNGFWHVQQHRWISKSFWVKEAKHKYHILNNCIYMKFWKFKIIMNWHKSDWWLPGAGGRGRDGHQRVQGMFWEWLTCSVFLLFWWFHNVHNCQMHWTLNGCSLLYVNYVNKFDF